MVHVEQGRRHQSTKNKTVERRADMLKRRPVHSASDLLVQPEIVKNVIRSGSPQEKATPTDLLEDKIISSGQSGTINPAKARRLP